jgi:alkylation response protein AidB-like acyl-CoA dehydrogenase
MHPLRQRLLNLAAAGQLELPVPGQGCTAERLAALYEFGRRDLSLARLAEAHTDALAILSESGRKGSPEVLAGGMLYGVWAADGPNSRLDLRRESDASLRLEGTKRFCSGAPLLDMALVTAHQADEVYLVEVRLRGSGLEMDAGEWASPAFRDTATATVTFRDVAVRESDLIGGPNWYLQRPGFWHGALGPAACWAGGAAGLVDAARKLTRSDPHARAQLGALEAAEWGFCALLRQAGDEIDADPEDMHTEARRRALMARHLIERLCTDTLDRFGRATGPQLLAFDASTAQRYAELTLFIRQCHAERDLASIPV